MAVSNAGSTRLVSDRVIHDTCSTGQVRADSVVMPRYVPPGYTRTPQKVGKETANSGTVRRSSDAMSVNKIPDHNSLNGQPP